MTDDMAMQRYKELLTAIRERDEAARRLEACEKRIAELANLTPEKGVRKPAKKTLTVNQFRAGILGLG